MKKKIILKKATRIEGNAKIHVEIKNNRVITARFRVEDFRGFEKFMQGRRIEHTPHLISRICGLCSASHQVASFKAIEDALSLEVSPSVKALREILILSERISSHALSYFFLTLPDFVGAGGGIFELMQSHREIANAALALRKAGQDIVRIIGKRAVHPVSLGIGGFLIAPDGNDLEQIALLAEEIAEMTRRLIGQLGTTNLKQKTIDVSTEQQINLLTYNHTNSGLFTVYDHHGGVHHTFTHDEFEENIGEMHAEWTFAKIPYLRRFGFPEGTVLVGPLSRSFDPDGLLSDPEIQDLELKKKAVDDRHFTLENYDVYRLLEILHASKRVLTLLDCIRLDELEAFPAGEASGKGTGVVEAPRGVLVHSYLINRGHIETMRLCVATQFNAAYINMLIKDLAQQHVQDDKLSAEGEHLIGRCVRIFDPCLSCASH